MPDGIFSKSAASVLGAGGREGGDEGGGHPLRGGGVGPLSPQGSTGPRRPRAGGEGGRRGQGEATPARLS